MVEPGQRLEFLLDAAIDHYGDRIATADHSVALSYRDLGLDAAAISQGLTSLGLRRGEPVVVSVRNRPSDLAAFLGIWRAVGVAVPLHAKAASRTVRHVFELTHSRLAVVPPEDEPLLAAGELAVSGRSAGICLLDIPPSTPDAALAGAALVVFTSGTTGLPKGVVLGHSGYCGKLRAIQQVLPFETGTRSLIALQLTFSFGQWTSLLTLATGGTVLLHPRFDAASAAAALAGGKVARMPIVPSMMRLLLSLLSEPAAAVRLRPEEWTMLFMAGGEPLPASVGLQLLARAPQARIADVYGLTETNSADFILPPDEYRALAGTIGRPSPGVDFRITSPDGRELPAGEIGELEVRTPYVMRGYLANPQATAAAFRGSFLRTGDLGIQCADGTVRLAGRSKDVINRGGNKISPIEIEDIFLRHPAVSGALAVGMEDPVMGEAIHLLVVPAQGQPAVGEAELLSWASRELERYKLPNRIHFAEHLPEGATGKADRKALRDLLRGHLDAPH